MAKKPKKSAKPRANPKKTKSAKRASRKTSGGAERSGSAKSATTKANRYARKKKKSKSKGASKAARPARKAAKKVPKAKRTGRKKAQRRQDGGAAEPTGATAKGPSSKSPAGRKKTARSSRRGKAAGSNHRPEQVVEEPPPLPKTRLSDKQLAEFQRLLLEKRAELVGDMDHLTNEALRRSRSEASGDLSSMPIHMADIGSDNWEQEFTLGLIGNERTLLLEIDDALQRIQDRTYGVCLGTRKRITVSRLRAKPWAKYCIEYARLREQGRTR